MALGCPAHAQPEGSSEEPKEDRLGVMQGEFGAEIVIEEDIEEVSFTLSNLTTKWELRMEMKLDVTLWMDLGFVGQQRGISPMPLFQKLPELVLLDGLCLPSPATLWSSTKVAIGTINCNPHLDGTHCILPFTAQRGNQVRRDTTAVASSHDAFGACPSRIPPNTGSDHCSMWCTDNADSGVACRVVEARYTKRNLALGGRSLSLLV